MGGRIPGPVCAERLGDDPLVRPGFSDAIPLGGGAGAGGTVTLTGWPRSIGWADFTEVAVAPDNAHEAAQIDSRAIQPTNVSVERSNGTVRVTAYTVTLSVFRDNSWVVASQKSGALLNHEQGHYDITGIVARDMVTQIGAARAASARELQEQIQAIIARSAALGERLTNLYDGDGPTGTRHGSHAANQTRWDDHLRRHRDDGLRLSDGPTP
jgi:hypothetical protein